MIEEMAIRPFRRPGRFAWMILALAAWALASVHPIEAQQAVTATSGDPGAIARIRALFAEIQREAPTYRRTTHELQGFSLEGGEVVGFHRGSELRKLATRHFGETWRGTEEYYFSDGRPIFILIVNERYDRPITMRFRVRQRIEDRYYFDGGRLIRHVHARYPVGEDEEDVWSSDADASELLEHARLFAACAAATGAEPPECTAPERGPQGS
jgi:hypothetical protein